MSSISIIEPLENLYFSVEWETTLKCNLDCSYCADGHDNSSSHPSLEDSLKTVDFIYEYVDLQMKQKPIYGQQHLNINIFGGESFFHPDILEILTYAQSKKSTVSWQVRVSTITNAVVGKNLWNSIAENIDYFTISYHAESLPKQKEQVKQNILHLKNIKKDFQINIMMHPSHWEDCMDMLSWCEEHQVTVNPRQIDHHWLDRRFVYDKEQKRFLTGEETTTIVNKLGKILTNGLSAQGRSCCSNQKLCTNSCNTITYVKNNNFKNWYCSVDKFFLYIKQATGDVFTNKDCRMNFQGTVGPIGNLRDTESIIDNLKKGTPTIVCKKSSCWCGLCAPKAKTQEDFERIMVQYVR